MGCVAPKTMIRDACVVGVALVMVYLLNGTYAHFVCNVCTTVPAFILTFIHLADYGKRLFAYKATLFYWVMNGFLLLSDSVFADSYGYFFGKFLLLSSLLFNFLYQNQVGKRAHERIQRNAHKATSQMSVATAISPADVLKFDETTAMARSPSISTAVSSISEQSRETIVVFESSHSSYSLFSNAVSGELGTDERSLVELIADNTIISGSLVHTSKMATVGPIETMPHHNNADEIPNAGDQMQRSVNQKLHASATLFDEAAISSAVEDDPVIEFDS